ncbi:MAG TPA: MarR family winged helix-turn-helix transcriptional regulator [Pseudonocardiaceae bacterium]|nr:MarR family winged helix-turn-helix transcriptional regulator [Pseudonocardiaceae bacterium]
MADLSQQDYASLLTFRTALRRFERWSGDQARQIGLTPAQHQLLLAVKGHLDRRGPTIGDVADYLGVRHHSVVGLVDRAVEASLIARVRDELDGRAVRLVLTPSGEDRIAQLSQLHLAELARLAPLLEHLTVEPHGTSADEEVPADPTPQHQDDPATGRAAHDGGQVGLCRT